MTELSAIFERGVADGSARIAHGGIQISERRSAERCEAGSNWRIVSTLSPKKSMRTGSGEVGGQMSTRGFAKDLEHWGLKYGVPREVLHPHGFRHFFAVKCLEGGTSITTLADLLGHASLDTTRIYLTMSEDKLRRSVNGAAEWIREAAGD